MQRVASNPSPWLNEPRCDNPTCHGSSYALTKPLYRWSEGHGGVYCAGCHDSPHAIATSRESNDAIKFVDLQGQVGTLRKCTVCHTSQPTATFQHTMMWQRFYLPVMGR
jgi:predicted CxxxxCH...CXXCH cytochrome family protein